MIRDDEHISGLIKGLKKNKRKAKKTLFLKYYAYVKSITLRYSKNLEDAEELVNDVFMKVFNKIDKYDDRYSFTSWLSQITTNTCIDKYRKSLRVIHVQPLDNIYESELPYDLQDIEMDVEILPIISELPANYRLVFNMYVFEEYSHKEIAESLNIAEGTSKSCLSRAKKIIRNYMQSNELKYKLENG